MGNINSDSEKFINWVKEIEDSIVNEREKSNFDHFIKYLKEIEGKFKLTFGDNPDSQKNRSINVYYKKSPIRRFELKLSEQNFLKTTAPHVPRKKGSKKEEYEKNIDRIFNEKKDIDLSNPESILEFESAIKESAKIVDQNKQNLNESNEYSIFEETFSRMITSESSIRQIILTGPPGTGKSYLAKMLAARLVLSEDDESKIKEYVSDKNSVFYENKYNTRDPIDQEDKFGRWSIIQLHPAYNYEDLVAGIKIKTESTGKIGYKIENKILLKMAEVAEKSPKNNYVLIVDEINRGNVASIFGELLYGLEYRGESVNIAYNVKGNGSIKIPENLYIIGTMNTADNSISSLDYALRRRFYFVKCLPDIEIISTDQGRLMFDLVKITCSEYLSTNQNLEDIQIGHTYFLTDSKDDIDKKLECKFCYQVYPMLRQYVKDGILKKDARIGNFIIAEKASISCEEVISIYNTNNSDIGDEKVGNSSEGRIGDFIYEETQKLFSDEKKISDRLIELLSDERYSNNLGLGNYSFLKPEGSDLKRNGISRYITGDKGIVEFKNKKYHICSQWPKGSIEIIKNKFSDWCELPLDQKVDVDNNLNIKSLINNNY